MKKSLRSYTKDLPVEKLQIKLEEMRINDIEQKKIKILNFLNFHENFFDLKDEEEKIIFSSKNFIKIITTSNEKDTSTYEIVNLYSLLFIKISEIIYSENKFIQNFSQETENDRFLLNYFFSLKQKEEIEMVRKNWFSLLIRYLSHLNMNNFFELNIPHIKNLVHDTLSEIFSKNVNLIELFNNDCFTELKFSLLVILIEMSLLTEAIREFGKSYSKERNEICQRKQEVESRLEQVKGNKKNQEEKLKEVEGKVSEVESRNPRVVYKDSEVIFYVRKRLWNFFTI
jgi:hypothetical protein